MRCSGWSSLAISVFSALLFAGPAAAHVIASPAYLSSESSESISFEAPNERVDPMIEFAVTAPPGLDDRARASGRGLDRDRRGSHGHVVGRIARLGSDCDASG